MWEIILLSIVSLLLFVLSVFFLGYFIFRKQKGFFVVLFFVLSILCAGFSFIRFIHISYRNITNTLKPRKGIDIYTSLWGKPVGNCTIIIDAQDAVIPIIDDGIWLHFKSCPQEIERLLSSKKYNKQIISTKDLYVQSSPQKWWKPQLMGKNIIVASFPENSSNEELFYISADSTEVYYEKLF